MLLERVAGNLMENAIRHNVPSGWIDVCTGRSGPSAELRVASSGPEIPGDRVEELFEPFRRGPVARTGNTPGSGLGLSIVRAVVLAHGGRLHAEPVPGGGLTVTVHLPTPTARPVAPRVGFRRESGDSVREWGIPCASRGIPCASRGISCASRGIPGASRVGWVSPRGRGAPVRAPG